MRFFACLQAFFYAQNSKKSTENQQRAKNRRGLVLNGGFVDLTIIDCG